MRCIEGIGRMGVALAEGGQGIGTGGSAGRYRMGWAKEGGMAG
jgi:hypothetical protein